MIYDLSKEIVDEAGEKATYIVGGRFDKETGEIEGGDKKVLTYFAAFKDILRKLTQEDDEETKFKIFELKLKIQAENPVELDSEDITLLRSRIGKFGTPIIVYRARQLLEKEYLPGSEQKSKK